MHLRHPATGGSAAPPPGGRFLVYLASRRHERPRELEHALLARVQRCRRERRPLRGRVERPGPGEADEALAGVISGS